MRGFPEHVVSSAINHLQHAGLINDRALAEDLKRNAITAKLLSQSSAKRFMLTKGIPAEIVDSTLIPDENGDKENAKKLVDKKLKTIKNSPPEKIKNSKKFGGTIARFICPLSKLQTLVTLA